MTKTPLALDEVELLDIPGHPSRLEIAARNAWQHYHHCQQSLQRAD
jgi:hypothetical protein